MTKLALIFLYEFLFKKNSLVEAFRKYGGTDDPVLNKRWTDFAKESGKTNHVLNSGDNCIRGLPLQENEKNENMLEGRLDVILIAEKKAMMTKWNTNVVPFSLTL